MPDIVVEPIRRRQGITPGKSGAFTLIELLVVIAIIAILAAILFPVFAQAREKARQTTCTSNFKQAALAALMYAQDYDEGLPLAAYNVTGQPLTTWYDVVEPYVKTGAKGLIINNVASQRSLAPLWICPSIGNTAVPQQPNDPVPGPFPSANYSPAYSYMANGNIMPMWHRNFATFGTFPGKPTGLGALQAPAQVVMFMEGLGYNPASGGDDWSTGCTAREQGFPPVSGPINGMAAIYCAARYRHSGGSVYAFCDGHVKWFRGPGSSWRTRAETGVAYQKSLAPNAVAWFRED
jgi:prepilin-type N-terminal cleavage/methylation domain-containing protein/prepilin-type processing-associated H-X9-DG protein